MTVDKEKIAMAALGGNGNEIVSDQLVRNDRAMVTEYFPQLTRSGKEVMACYEAGCFGFRMA